MSVKNIIYLLIVIFLSSVFSCKSKSHKKLVTGSHDTVLQFKTGPLSKSDSLFLNGVAEKWFDKFLKRSNFNGGFLVAKNDRVVFEKYSGLASFPNGDSISSNTPFHIASVSKTFTAMAILKLWQEGKIDINKNVSNYLDSFNYPGVTVKTLLNHRSGLPNYLHFMEELNWDKKQFATNKDVFNILVNKKDEIKNIGRPDASFNYCNTNYVLLALIIEKVSGMSYPEYIRNNFFNPIGMKHSFVYTPADSGKITYSFDWKRNLIPMDFLDHTYGDKNIYSTPEDILKWDMALNSNLIFSDSVLNYAYTPYSNEKPGVRNYGLGWRMNIFPDGKKTVYHNGWWHGNNAVFLRVPYDNITIIVLGNVYNRSIYKAHEMLSDIDSKSNRSEIEDINKEGGAL